MDASAYAFWSVIAAGITAIATAILAGAAIRAGHLAFRHLDTTLKQLHEATKQFQLATDVAKHQQSTVTHIAIRRFSKIFEAQHKIIAACAEEVARNKFDGKSPSGKATYTAMEMMSSEESVYIYATPKALRALRATLNELEDLAVGVQHDVYNVEIIYHVMHNTVEYAATLAAAFVRLHRKGAIRGHRGEPEAYTCIDDLCRRLTDIQQNGLYFTPSECDEWLGYS